MTSSGALLTDLYQLTMACGYWKSGLREREAVFHHFFRDNPFGNGFALFCGLPQAMEWLTDFRFTRDDLDYLAGRSGGDGSPLFDRGFLDFLATLRFTCDVDAVPEGTVVFPGEPLVRVTGPLIQAQLIETALLTILNFQTLIATKAARICAAAEGDAVVEFGLRRAQGVDGGLSASRAAHVGGCLSTSNVLAGRLFGIPVAGTHAHSWILSFEDEREAFLAYARAMPHDCILLVDTYDTLQGVEHAVEVGRVLRESGRELAGIRLDSGDLAVLSREARRILDRAGFRDVAIVGSGDLDEYAIADLKRRGAEITVWGVGTRLATAYEEPALGGVYKLAAVRDPGGAWSRRGKRTNSPGKATVPGILQVRRRSSGGRLTGDLLRDLEDPVAEEGEDLLRPVIRAGRAIHEPPNVTAARDRARDQIEALPAGVRRLIEPEVYPVTRAASLEARVREAMQ